jgi:hypothetical protein
MKLGNPIRKFNDVRISTEVLPFINKKTFGYITHIIMHVVDRNVKFLIDKI